VAAVAKHFPGMGAARVDPHLDLPAVSLSEDTFESIHRLPFKKLMADGINGIMSTHLCCTGLDNDGTIPATFSTAIVADYIRKRCGYDGLIFSDDLEMGAIARHHRIGDACLGALEAGHDVLLICREYGRQASGFEAVLHACERSAEAQARLAESLRRIAALRQFCATPPFANRQLPAIAPGELAETIARDSVTVISAGTVPLPVDAGDTSEIHLIIPDLSSMPLLEDGYELSERHPIISACRACFPGRCTFQFFPMNPRPADVERIAATAAGHRDCILFLSDALGNPGQRDLIAKIRERCRHPLFILLDNPFDHALIAPDETCLTAYGSRKVQIQALAKVKFC
jgi:beta-N-acetylhexosaminidase